MAMQLLPFIHVLIFLSSFIKVSVASEFAVNFTTTPKDAEYFVGSEAILQWEYSSSPTGAVQHIKFGIQALPQDKGSASQDVTIFVKDVLRRDVQFNTKTRRDITAPFNGRATVVENQTASFRIRNLTLNDTGKYFCRLEPADSNEMAEFDYVKIKVVDLMIDRKNSTQVMESWEGHKISLKCAVTKAHPNSPVRFFWTEHSDGTSLIGKQVDWKEISQMTMVTTKDEDFQPVTCTAKTLATTQTLTIIIKRLYKPREPINVTVQEFRSNSTQCPVYNRLIWQPPVDDSGTPVTGYMVEYKHPVFNRVLINKTVTHVCTEHVICKLQASGYPREVHVDIRAINKVGRGFRSRTVPVSFFSSPSAPLNLTNSLARKERPPFDVRIAWSPPEENGGSPVVQYSLEYKERGAPWIDGTELTTNNTYMTIIKNEKAYSYEVRVTARNRFGLGAASKVMTVHFAETPDPPQDLVKGEVFYDKQKKPNIKVVWKPPKYDGGSAVSHYIVEHKTVKTEWSTAVKVTVKKTEYSFQVETSETYTVRTRAVNSMGVGQPAVVTVKFTAKDQKTLARSNKSRSSTTYCGSLGVLLLMLAMSRALA